MCGAHCDMSILYNDLLKAMIIYFLCLSGEASKSLSFIPLKHTTEAGEMAQP